MKRVMMKLAVALMLLTLSTTPAWAQARIATVDLRKIFNGYWKTKEAESTLKERAAELTKERRGLEDDLKKDNEDYKQMLTDANDQAVSAEERDKRKTAAEAKLKDMKGTEDTLQQFNLRMRDTLEGLNRRMRDGIVKEISDTVAARGKSAGFSLVLDAAAQTSNETPVILYNNNDNDLTDAVLSQLNATAPPPDANAPAGKSESKPSDTKTPDKM